MNEDDIRVDFWDVGQGDSSSLTLPDGNMIFIDVGPPENGMLYWMANRSSCLIEHLILTHNDLDHVGGLEKMLGSNVVINNAYLINDDENKRVLRLYKKLKAAGTNIARLECESNKPRVIFQWTDYVLELRFPNMQDAINKRSPNEISGIICLRYKDKDCIIWGADNKLSTIASHSDASTHTLFGPHHGAPLNFDKEVERDSIHKLSPKLCFISTGHNGYGHPNREYIRELAQNRCQVMCSQVTKNCCKKLWERGQDINDSMALYGLSQSRRKPKSTTVQCNGHVRGYLDKNGIFSLDSYSDGHAGRIEALAMNLPCEIPKSR